jgi:hypothetical protein
VYLDDRHAGRDQHEREGDERRRHGDGACAPVRGPAIARRDPRRERDEHQSGRGGGHAGDVAAGRVVVGDMDHVQRAVGGGEPAEREGDAGAQAGPHTPEQHDRGGAEDQRETEGDRMAIGRHAGLTIQERIVERVDERDGRGGREDERLAGHALQGARQARARAAVCGGGGHVTTVPAQGRRFATARWRPPRGSS